MLHDFLATERSAILLAAKQRAIEIRGVRITSDAVELGWSMFFDELVGLLQRDQPFEYQAERGLHTAEAEKQGTEYLRLGYTLSEVVHSYGALCQAITGWATKLNYEITPREFRQLNLSLDTVIAEAVSEFERLRRKNVESSEVERLGFLAHELRNCLQSATISLEMIETGAVSVRSSTGSMLHKSLKKMADLIDTALTEVRLRSEPQWNPERVRVLELMREVEVLSEEVRFLQRH